MHRDGIDQSNTQVNEFNANPVLTANACSGILQVVAIRLSSGANPMGLLAVCDAESTVFHWFENQINASNRGKEMDFERSWHQQHEGRSKSEFLNKIISEQP